MENPSVAPEAIAQYKGAQVVENPQFSISREDEGALTRMSTTDGTIGWDKGDKVGLVWLNAMAISDNYDRDMPSLSDWYPTTNLHYSNTRITHDGNSVFSMKDGQLYAGQYIAYHPYDENMKQVGEFSLKQSDAQEQNTSAVVDDAAYDYLAKNMNWLSRDDNNASGKSTFLYHIDANKAGLVKTIHIPMRRYSNIFEGRFVSVTPNVSQITWDDLTIQKVELIANSEIFPTQTIFDFSKGLEGKEFELERDADGNYIEIASVESDKNGDPIPNYKKDAEGYPAKFVVGLQQVGHTQSLPALINDESEEWFDNVKEGLKKIISLDIVNEAKVGENPEDQRAMFLLLPTTAAGEKTELSIKIYTDYGYVVIPESEWKSYIGVDPDPVVNGTNWGSQYMFQGYEGLKEAGKTATQLLSLIGQKITRFIDVNPDDLVYNDIEVNSMDELRAALDKWNKLGEDGEFRVYVTKNNNNFQDFDWSTGSQHAEVKTFLADMNDNLVITVKPTAVEMNLSGTTTLNDPIHAGWQHANCTGHLTINGKVDQTNGVMNVKNSEVIPNVNIANGAELNIDAEKVLSGTGSADLSGVANINGTLQYPEVKNYSNATANVAGLVDAQNVISWGTINLPTKGKVAASASVTNHGTVNSNQHGVIETETLNNNKKIVTNGDIDATTINNNKDGEYRMKTHCTTEVDNFQNAGKIFYDEQGAKFAYTNTGNGKSIATIQSGDATNTLADYIINANAFKCTDLDINPNDNLTTAQWDNSLHDVALNFVNVTMNDGVTVQFNKNLKMAKATVTVSASAKVVWKKGETVDTPEFKVSKVVVNSGSTLEVSGIKVVNAKKTEVNFGSGSQTVTIKGMSCFNLKGASEIPAGGTNGTIVIE